MDDSKVYLTVNAALAKKGGVLWDLEQEAEADPVYAALLLRNEARKQAGRDEYSLLALSQRGLYALNQEHFDVALAFLDEALRRLGPMSGDPFQIACNMVNRAHALGETGRLNEALDQYNALLDRFGTAEGSSLQRPLAIAAIKRGCKLQELGRETEALVAWDAALTRFGPQTSDKIEDLLVMACSHKQVVLAGQGKLELDTAVLEQGLGFVEKSPYPADIQLYCDLMSEKAELWRSQGRYAEAGTAFRAAVDRIPENSMPELLQARVSLLNSLGCMQVLVAKQRWTQTQTRIPAVKRDLEAGLATLREAKSQEAEADVQAMLLCNQAYALFLLGREAEAAPLLKAGLRQGGEELYKGELEDTTLVPCPADKGFKALVEKTWKHVKPKRKAP